MFLQPHPAIFEQLPFLSHLTPSFRGRVIRSSGHYAAGEPTAATAPPAADAEQIERDWFFGQLVAECRAGSVRQSRINWLLSESGKTEDELWNAVEAAD